MQLVKILLGTDYLRSRWKGIAWAGLFGIAAGIFLIFDSYYNSKSLHPVHFPVKPFGALLLIEGAVTFSMARTGTGGQRRLRYVKGAAFILFGILILFGQNPGNFVLSMLFGTLMLLDGILQGVSAYVVRYRKWRVAAVGAAVEVVLAITILQPYPTHYVGTVPYCLGLGLCFAGWNLLVLASRVRVLDDVGELPMAHLDAGPRLQALPPAMHANRKRDVIHFDGPPGPDEPALTVHVWTPMGSAKEQAHGRIVVRRYIAAVDSQGAISTGHAALEAPQGIYISLYPAQVVDQNSSEFRRLLRATQENDVPGTFQPDYPTESSAWCPSTRQVRIRNYDPGRLQSFWQEYQRNSTYNLTKRNCSTSVALALDAAMEGVASKVWGPLGGWQPLLRVLVTPELWVAGQIRKRARTMTWTPGLALDYARALSMLADPRISSWTRLTRWLLDWLRHPQGA
ncbi:HdeD family acid-resistance protein [Paraburkholderia bannensis]|uniref:HdeD family acid-resistance protein n=1 Tax=Paraburkholderia bannensis TaxID=765414 RepID=UPI002ABE628A|nr:DUF308 domain-containing protein [Paraburkholderia bannensis]